MPSLKACGSLAVRNRFLRSLLIGFFVLLYCEVFHYAVVLLQCTWPSGPVSMLEDKGHLKVMFVADTHILGSRLGHWFDKLRREWQMKQAFQTSMFIHKPDVVFVLGDLLDEGKWCSDEEFQYHVSRFKSMFAVPSDTQMHVLSGNHDEGFHYMMSRAKHQRFKDSFASPSVRHLHIKNNTFVLVNSMAMEGDGCGLCSQAEQQLDAVVKHLDLVKLCAKDPTKYDMCAIVKGISYTKPILLQHYPLYRRSDADCNTSDSAPPGEKDIPFRVRFDCLDQRSSNMLLRGLHPRLVVSAHTHHGCYLVHPGGVPEWSVASFSWRNRNDPTFLMGRVTPSEVSISQCRLPQESTVLTLYILAAVVIVVSLLWPRPAFYRRRKRS